MSRVELHNRRTLHNCRKLPCGRLWKVRIINYLEVLSEFKFQSNRFYIYIILQCIIIGQTVESYACTCKKNCSFLVADGSPL